MGTSHAVNGTLTAIVMWYLGQNYKLLISFISYFSFTPHSKLAIVLEEIGLGLNLHTGSQLNSVGGRRKTQWLPDKANKKNW